jgi:hypothetical protein
MATEGTEKKRYQAIRRASLPSTQSKGRKSQNHPPSPPDRLSHEGKVLARRVLGDCGAWLRIMVGCDENTFARERREMLTAHRIFIIAKSQPKARG